MIQILVSLVINTGLYLVCTQLNLPLTGAYLITSTLINFMMVVASSLGPPHNSFCSVWQMPPNLDMNWVNDP